MRKLVFIFASFFCNACLWSQTTLLSENFNAGDPPIGWSKFNFSSGGIDPSAAAWTIRPDGYTYSSGNFSPVTFHSNDNSQFYLTISDAQGGGETLTMLQSNSFSTLP